jgi:hypothetical protein
MNGRQIRNAITTGRQLALYKEKELDYLELQNVIKIVLKFDKYMKQIQEGRSDDEIAGEKGLRA